MKAVEADAEHMAKIQVGEAEKKLRDAQFDEKQAGMKLSMAAGYREFAENQLKAAELILELVKGSYE